MVVNWCHSRWGTPNPNLTQGLIMWRLLWQAVSSCRRRDSAVRCVTSRMLLTLLSRDFTLCDCVDMWCFPVTHWILTKWVSEWVTADWHEESSAGWMCSGSSGNKDNVSCMNLRMFFMTLRVHRLWSWVIFTSCRCSKESSTGLAG